MNKRFKIEQQLESTAKHLADAEEYVARNVNVEGAAWLHTDDWNGRSGHPLWMKNFMIPATRAWQSKKEKALETLDKKDRDKLKQRRPRSKRS